MKINLVCKDLLLERALELFLKEHLVKRENCDFIVCDEKISGNKPQFIITHNSPFLSVPFSKENLLSSLEEFDTALKLNAKKLVEEEKRILETRIENIANEFKKDYEKKINSAILDLKDKLVKALINE